MTHDTTSAPDMRLDLHAETPALYRAMLRLEREVRAAGLEPALLELVKTRASQLNGCAYCIDMHTKDALHQGESAQRLFALSAWRETPFYTERERAALALTEAVTLLAETGVPDEAWEQAAERFDREELGALVFAITAINAWNRLAVSTRMVPGTYEPA